ncbi:hypothetical protein PKOR_16305 [Pontibacter korlensis]|uniref:Uncharacterized protein n=1 Tax=Pontibacter korlensis TaxID=400092 RepID=A0A0E3UXL2_9BACT|nr:hypothetical protein PKOR_16305 [Pontibacter korlensis]
MLLKEAACCKISPEKNLRAKKEDEVQARHRNNNNTELVKFYQEQVVDVKKPINIYFMGF